MMAERKLVLDDFTDETPIPLPSPPARDPQFPTGSFVRLRNVLPPPSTGCVPAIEPSESSLETIKMSRLDVSSLLASVTPDRVFDDLDWRHEDIRALPLFARVRPRAVLGFAGVVFTLGLLVGLAF